MLGMILKNQADRSPLLKLPDGRFRQTRNGLIEHAVGDEGQGLLAGLGRIHREPDGPSRVVGLNDLGFVTGHQFGYRADRSDAENHLKRVVFRTGNQGNAGFRLQYTFEDHLLRREQMMSLMATQNGMSHLSIRLFHVSN